MENTYQHLATLRNDIKMNFKGHKIIIIPSVYTQNSPVSYFVLPPTSSVTLGKLPLRATQ